MNETFETIYHVQSGMILEHRRYNKNNEYVGRYHYQYYGDAFGTERNPGYISSVDDARELLEKIFKQKSSEL